MSKSYDFLVFIGRFQPFHNGRLMLVRDALFGMDDAQAEVGMTYLTSSTAKAALPEPVRRQLINYCNSPAYAEISSEAGFLAKYRSTWAESPYHTLMLPV